MGRASRSSAGRPLPKCDRPGDHFDNQPIALYDDVIMRTIVDLTDDQVKSLAALCAAQGISRAEAVRRAVARLLAEEHRPNRSRAFGAWSEKKLDSAATVRQLRDEWE